MSEIHQVYATVRLPRDDDPGRVAVGYFTLVGDVLTMTNSKGVPVRGLSTGKPITHRMQAGDNAHAIASRLTLKIQRAVSGETDFNRPIDYPRWGNA
jgi:hypothetical protein